MGVASSTNVIDQAINASIKVLNETTTDCTSKVNGVQEIIVRNPCFENVKISGNKFTNVVEFDIRCAQDAANQNDTKQQVQTEMDQLAETLVGSLGIGYAKSKNVTKLTQTMATDITNRTTLNCFADVGSKQSIIVERDDPECKDRAGELEITYNEMSNLTSGITACMQKEVNSNSAAQDLKSIVRQKATATVEGVLGPFLMILIVLLLLFGGTLKFGKDLLTSPAFIAGIIALVLIYLALAWWRGWFPF
jgi:hypothetical protein